MRKNALRITVGAVLCVGISAAWLTANGQVSAPPSRSLPKNPLDFLKAAAQVNGLETDEIGPWHLKATFTLFDALGNPTDHGSYEVLWVNHHQGKGSERRILSSMDQSRQKGRDRLWKPRSVA